jgi:hypothetical protein
MIIKHMRIALSLSTGVMVGQVFRSLGIDLGFQGWVVGGVRTRYVMTIAAVNAAAAAAAVRCADRCCPCSY